MICRTDRIGDVILTLPVADALREAYPDAQIDMLVQSRVWELINDYPALNGVHKLDKVTISGVKELCKENNYDLAIAVYPSFSLAMGLLLGRVKYRLGTGYRWYSFLFNLKHYQHRKEAIKHESRYNLDLLEAINLHTDKELTPSIKVLNEYLDEVYTKIPGLDLSDKFIVIHIPSLGSAKVWSDENFHKLINLLLEDVNNHYKVVLTGTREDESQVKFIMAKLPQNNRVIGVFNLNLKEFAALLSKAELFLGNSTGPIHIAAAVGTFVVGLYSPVKVESPVRWGPLTDKKKIFVPETDDDTRDVMNDITPETVYNFIKDHIANKL